jgi:hypothetical protein
VRLPAATIFENLENGLIIEERLSPAGLRSQVAGRERARSGEPAREFFKARCPRGKIEWIGSAVMAL